MHRKDLLDQLNQYAATSLCSPEHRGVVDQFVNFIADHPACFERTNRGHITSSAWILNRRGTAVLLTHHRKLRRWLQLGGHNDGDPDCATVAEKEAREESGIEQFQFLIPTIFDIDVHPIPGACVRHFDVRFALQAQDEEFVVSDESLELAWVPFDRVPALCAEPSILRMLSKQRRVLCG